jgi:hypothetical protein
MIEADLESLLQCRRELEAAQGVVLFEDDPAIICNRVQATCCTVRWKRPGTELALQDAFVSSTDLAVDSQHLHDTCSTPPTFLH